MDEELVQAAKKVQFAAEFSNSPIFVETGFLAGYS
jgi:hypothetical protein